MTKSETKSRVDQRRRDKFGRRNRNHAHMSDHFCWDESDARSNFDAMKQAFVQSAVKDHFTSEKTKPIGLKTLKRMNKERAEIVKIFKMAEDEKYNEEFRKLEEEESNVQPVVQVEAITDNNDSETQTIGGLRIRAPKTKNFSRDPQKIVVGD